MEVFLFNLHQHIPLHANVECEMCICVIHIQIIFRHTDIHVRPSQVHFNCKALNNSYSLKEMYRPYDYDTPQALVGSAKSVIMDMQKGNKKLQTTKYKVQMMNGI